MAGALYIWIMLGFFTCAAALILLITALLYLGHWYQKKTTGATHGFLEKPPDPPKSPATPRQKTPAVLSIGIEAHLEEDSIRKVLTELFSKQRVRSHNELLEETGSLPWEEIADIEFSLSHPPKGELQTVLDLTMYRHTD